MENKNISTESNMTYEERINMMKENLGLKFVDQAKTIIKDSKVIKGIDAKDNFNTELNELTFEIEEIYPLNFEQFVTNYPKTVELVETVNGSVVVNSVKKGLVIQGWSLESNVNEVISNINKNVTDKQKAKEAIALRKAVMKEIADMKKDYGIEWNQDLFWKLWKIKEGEARWNYLKSFKGEQLAQKRIDNIRAIGGLEFIEALQKEVYGE